ncbi:MAG: DNA polymerase ligase N-terminal domain-containing protein [Methanobacteriota archaeon]
MQTEDHPLDYADFEGEIPEGLYGTGRVEIWDRGGCKLKEKTENKIEFTLYGDKLKGDYVLIKYKKSERMPVEKSAGAVIFRKNDGIKYLLLHYAGAHRTGTHWDFVKGNVEEGEEEKATVAREIEEETGIKDINFIEGFRESINYFYKREKRLIYKEVVFYLVQTRSEEVKLSYEHVGYEWLGYEEAMQRLTYRNARNVLRKAHELLFSV